VIEFRDEVQKKLYSKIKEFINSDNNTLLVSGPPGSGKTFVTICSLLDNFDGKIVVILRTHSEQDHYAKLFTNNFLPIRGIEYHCKIPQVKMHPLRNQLCKWMRIGKHTICRGCPYRMQFLNIPKYKIRSFLYSHSAELIKSVLESLEEYIIVFDEYHHVLPKEQVISSAYIKLASAEYGEELKLNISEEFSDEKISEMRKIGERNWKRAGYSYLLSLVETIEYLKSKNRWFYKVDEGYAYLDDSIYSLISNVKIKKIFISATPLPQIERLLRYNDKFTINYQLKNVIFCIYTGFKYSFEERRNEKVIKHIRKLLYYLSKYKSVIFFPSHSALKSVYSKLPENFTTIPSEFPTCNVLLIAGGKYAEGIDLPSDIEVIVVLGIPYDDPVYHNPHLKQLFKYFKLYDVSTRKILYDYRALLKAIQSFGRGIRNVDQRLIIILADRRYTDEKWLELMPEWLRANILKFQFFTEIDEFIARALLFSENEALKWLEERRKWKDFAKKYAPNGFTLK